MQTTNTVLKIIRGTARADRRRDETATAVSGTPEIPKFVTLDADERAVFDELVKAYDFARSPLGRCDGLQFAELAKLICAIRKLDAKIAEYGPVILAPSGRAVRSPYSVARHEAGVELRHMLNEMGLSPTGRLRLAPVAKASPKGSAWDKFD